MEDTEEKVAGFDRRDRKRDWTKGSVFRNLVFLAWPIIVGNSLNLLGPFIDMVWVGKLGAAAIAGVGVASMAVRLVTSARMGLSQGTRALVARFIGAGDIDGANHVGQQAVIISSIYVIIMVSIGIFFVEPIMRIFGLQADVVAEGAAYMRIILIGSIAMSFRMLAEAIMQASGDTVTPMRITVFFRIFHAALAPFLIFGWWIFPRMGVSGAAMTNVISQSLGGAIALWVLFSGRSRLRLTMRKFRFDLSMIWRILKIGVPVSIMTTERTFGNMILIGFMGPFGTLAVAGHILIDRIQVVLRMPCLGLGVGAGVLVGQNLGARQPDRAEKNGWLAVGLAEVFTLIASLVILLWAENIIRVFNSEPDVVGLASVFLRIHAAAYLVTGFNLVLQHCISGAGDTLPPMIVTLLNLWLVQLPLAYVLSRYTHLGMYGVRWAIVAGIVTGAIAYTVYFKLGRWKLRKV